MRWLLITVIEGNPGDMLIRRGIKRIIRAVDSDAEFDLVAKNDSSTWTPRPFDRAVICGMPLFWDEPFSVCTNEAWWGRLVMGWPTADRRRAIAIGVGSCAAGKDGASRAARHVEAAASRMHRVVLRDDCIRTMAAEVLCCPAVFAVDRSGRRERLVNLMPSGGHWDEFAPAEAANWRARYNEITETFRDNGWKLVAHSKGVASYALRSGWGDVTLADTADKLADAYSGCTHFFGNRVHGAIASAAVGAHVWCVGYDSRRFAARAVGAHVSRPTKSTREQIEAYAAGAWAPRRADIAFNRDAAFNRYVDILKDFIS